MMIIVSGTYYQEWSYAQSVMEMAHFGNGNSWLCYIGYDNCQWVSHKRIGKNLDGLHHWSIQHPENVNYLPLVFVKWLKQKW